MIFYLIAGAALLFSMVVQRTLKATYGKWSRVGNAERVSGARVARAILDANDMSSMPVEPVPGRLKDHYDPRTKVVRLSPEVYGAPSVAALAIAAHEAGHAIQDRVDYGPLEFRTGLAPLAAAGARFGLPAAIFGAVVGLPLLVPIGVLAYAGALVLQFVTLPVEFDASRRALAELDRLGLMTDRDREGARKVLRAAAMTYVAGTASAAGYVFYLLLVGGRYLRPSSRLAKPGG